jgi:hypothetical protein
MITNEEQMKVAQERITWFLNQAADLRKTETNHVNYRAAVSGFLAEVDRMQLEVREYLSFLPAETAGGARRESEGHEWTNRGFSIITGIG